MPELYPTVDPLERSRMIQILTLQSIAKFCHYAENLGAIAIAFKDTYDDEKEEMKGIFNKISTYGVGEIVDFYDKIQHRELSYIAKIVGYPPLDLQDTRCREFLESSCQRAKDKLTEIGANYLDFRQLYNAYKHGYRVFIGENSNTRANIFPFIDDSGKQKFIEIDNKKLERIFAISQHCRQILEGIFKQHHSRTDYESKGGGKQDAINTTLFFKENEKRPTRDDLHVFYPNRGERLKTERTEADSIYNIFKEELEKEHMGKIIAIDMDAKKIISKDYNLDKILKDLRTVGSSGRIHIRKITKDGRLGIQIY